MIVNLYSQTPANSGTLGFYDKSYVDFAGFEVSNGWLASCHKGSPEYAEPWKPYSGAAIRLCLHRYAVGFVSSHADQTHHQSGDRLTTASRCRSEIRNTGLSRTRCG